MDLTNSNIAHKIGLFLQAKGIEKDMKNLQKISSLKNWRKVVCESALRQRN
jgi:menaquinone-dependent protoporphyrinogen IX oxidase